MTENESSGAQIQPPIIGDTRGGVYPAVGVDRHNYVTPGSQTLGEISVAFVTRHNHKTRRTGTGERILYVDIEPPGAGAFKATARGMVAVEEDQYRMGTIVQIRGPVDARPQLGEQLRRNQRVDGRIKLVFGTGRRKWAWRRCVRRRLSERGCRGGEHGGKKSKCEHCILHRVLLGDLLFLLGDLLFGY